jgi:hypothetical protein
MNNYELTEKPEIYKGVYWGTDEYKEENVEIIENRNRFIKAWGIRKSRGCMEIPKYVLNQSQIYPYATDVYGVYVNICTRKDFADHSEFYKTKTGYAVIISPCSDMYEEEAKSYGYKRIQPLHKKEFPTYIKTNFMAKRKSAKEYYLEELENQKEKN